MTIDSELLRAEGIRDSEEGNVADSSELGGSARSAFGYFGSKHSLAKKILPHLPRHNCWVELFCGSAALTLTKSPAGIEIINDLDEEIVNVFRQLREHPKEVIQAVSTTPYARREYIQATCDTGNFSDLERARRFLVRAMMSVNGVQGKARGGFSFSNSFTRGGVEARVSRWKNFPERLEAVVLRLRNVRIECRDAVDLLSDLSDRPATLVYVDPPYLSRRAMGYSVEANEEAFHAKLLRQVNRSKCMIAISAYESAVYSRFLSKSDGWSRVDLDAHTKATDGNQRKRGEILWLNSAASNALESESVPIQLSLEERRNNKTNPAR